MKRILTLSAIICFSHYSNAQTPNANANTQWKINGNNASTTDFMGTINNQSLIFKTNNLERLQLDAQGKMILNSGKEMIINPGGLVRPEKTNPISAYMLKVGGSGHFDGEVNTRQLFVQEYITYLKSLKGPRMDVDTIRMDSTRGIFGHTKIFGDVQIKQNLEVLGKTTLKGDLIAEKGIMFDATNGIEFIPASSGSHSTYRLGSPTSHLDIIAYPLSTGGSVYSFGTGKNPGVYSSCLPPLNPGDLSINTRLSINGSTNSLDLYNAGYNAYINLGTDLGYAIPEGTPLRKIEIANLCASDVEICKHPGNISYLSTGPNVEIGNPTRNSLVTLNIKSLGSQTEAVQVTDNIGHINFKIKTNGHTEINASTKTDKYFVVNDASTPSSPIESFVVHGDGRTAIGDSYVPTGYQLAVKGKVLAEEVVVQLRNDWPDYVFNKDYKLKPLSEVEQYIFKNKHLQNIPSAQEIEANGVTLGNVVSKQMEKIEELTLYLIEQQKQIEELKKRVESLKK